MSIHKFSKKINVVSQFWPPSFVGGGEISTYIVCQKLVKKGYEVTILTPNIPKKNDESFRFSKLYNPSKFLKPFERNYFSRISLKGDLPKGVYWASDYYGAAYLRNKKVKKFVTVRDHWPICLTSLNLLDDYSPCDGCSLWNFTKHYGIFQATPYKKLLRLFSLLYNHPFRKSILLSFDHVVFVSDYIANKIVEQIPLKDYSRIYNPLPRDFIKNYPSNEIIKKNILFSGFMKEFKGIDVILRVMEEIKRVDKDYQLNIVGYGDLEKYQGLVWRMGLKKQVKFKGKLSMKEIAQIFAMSTFVVVPSLCYETFGRTVIEGMSQKCVVIATNRGGPSEIIKNGRNGFLFKLGDYSQVAKIILRLYNNPRKVREIKQNARKFSIENFSPDKIANQYESLIKKLY